MNLDAGAVGSAVEDLIRSVDLESVAPQDFFGLQFDHGLAWVEHNKPHGGLAVDASLQTKVAEQVAAQCGSRLARPPSIHLLLGPTIYRWGTEEQRSRYLRGLFSGAEGWCQLLSEPDAGSDLAGLRTTAVLDGDRWIANGNKVWTSFGHTARWSLLLARTGTPQSRHRGLSAFIVDMRSSGIDVRPIRQMTGDVEFNEVFLTDVEIADDMRLGGVGEGWSVVMTMLAYERLAVDAAVKHVAPIDHAVAVWNAADPGRRSPARRAELAALWVRSRVNDLTSQRFSETDNVPKLGTEPSIVKLQSAELAKEIFSWTVDLMGPAGSLYDTYDRDFDNIVGDFDTVRYNFMRSRADTIAGGTSEIQRNIIAERSLGLPRELS